MYIWFANNIALASLQGRDSNTLSAHLGIVFTGLGDDYLQATMPVNERTKQPYGILHGGASAALAETVGSVASSLVVNTAEFRCVGLEINANHIRSVSEGSVTATCKPLHLGRQTHVWDIQIHHDDTQKLVCVSRLTVVVLPR